MSFGVGGGQKGERRIQQQSASFLYRVPTVWQVLVAASQVAALYCNQVHVLMWFNPAELVQQGGATAQAAFTNKRVISRVRCVRVWTQDRREWNTKKEGDFTLENELLAYVWLLNAVLIPLRYPLWDLTRQVRESTATKRDVYEKQHSAGQPQWKYIWNILQIKTKGERKWTVVPDYR